jgi:SAM-dependent methyltransferase
MIRTHDRFYLNEKNLVVKDSFIAVANKISDSFSGSVADVGCATGAFPAYLKQRFQSSEVVGIEYLEELLSKAEKDFPNVRFIRGDVTVKSSVEQKFDVITMLGVLGLFDNFEKVLTNVLSWLKPKGKLVLHSMVSEFDVDVFIKYSSSSKQYISDNLESGWNIISERSLQLVSEKNAARLVSCEKFVITVDLDKQDDDVMRSWTEINHSNERDIFNALHVRQPQKIVVIEKL